MYLPVYLNLDQDFKRRYTNTWQQEMFQHCLASCTNILRENVSSMRQLFPGSEDYLSLLPSMFWSVLWCQGRGSNQLQEQTVHLPSQMMTWRISPKSHHPPQMTNMTWKSRGEYTFKVFSDDRILRNRSQWSLFLRQRQCVGLLNTLI